MAKTDAILLLDSQPTIITALRCLPENAWIDRRNPQDIRLGGLGA
jgi:predicted transcriptional regulator